MHTALIIDADAVARRRLRVLLHKAFTAVETLESDTAQHIHAQLKYAHFSLAFIEPACDETHDLIETIKQQSPHTLCVAITQNHDEQGIRTVLQAGAQGYLLKDRPDTELIQQLKAIQDGHPPLSPPVVHCMLKHFQRLRDAHKHSGLTQKEKEVLTLIAKGMSRGDTAVLLNISDNTAAGYIKNIYRKLDISSRAEAAQEAIRIGLIQP